MFMRQFKSVLLCNAKLRFIFQIIFIVPKFLFSTLVIRYGSGVHIGFVVLKTLESFTGILRFQRAKRCLSFVAEHFHSSFLVPILFSHIPL